MAGLKRLGTDGTADPYSEVGEDHTAFGGGRSPRFAVTIIGLATTADRLSAERAWVRAFWEALRPHALGIGGYINFESEYSDDRVRSSYGPVKYERLARIKRVYDPDNVFRRNTSAIDIAAQPVYQEARDVVADHS